MRRERRGMNLIEVMVCGAILGLFMTIVCHALVVAYRTYTLTTKKSTDYRLATVAVDRLTRELRASDRVYSPDPATTPWSTFGSYIPEVGVNPPLVFRTYDSTGERVLGYRWDKTARTVQRMLYDPTFDPANTATHNVLETKKVTFEVDNFAIQRMDPALTSGVPFLLVEMKLSSVLSPILTEVRVKSL
ncbi:prepilin-type N-terminal cleavage/methylation domain-containing protein [bacterium CPR1]|nr:prepilin-type N-terminal cleavage/methylation domain-containing protein [bacterium CPR1]